MAQTDGLTQLLNAVAALQQQAAGRPADAIDAELAAPRRRSAVADLANDPAVEAFRSELVDGLIRVDTLNRVLSLIAAVIERMV